jgi:hypothetical protein
MSKNNVFYIRSRIGNALQIVLKRGEVEVDPNRYCTSKLMF